MADVLAAGRFVLGSWFATPGGFAAESYGRMGFDCVVVDLQHGALTFADLLATLQGFDLAGMQALVRTQSDAPGEIMKALDLGAAGVVVPMVSTAEQAERIVAATRYAPAGIRSFGPTRALKDAYAAEGQARRRWCLPMIETRAGVANAAAIAAVDGVDGLLVGPGDLALDLGLPLGSLAHPALREALAAISAACCASGKLFAATWFDAREAGDLLSLGPDLLIYGSDCTHQQSGVTQAIAAIREWTT